MHRYLVRRLLLFIPTLLGVLVVVFLLMHIVPGDVAVLMLGGTEGYRVDPAKLAELRHELGLDRPILVQFGDYLWDLLRFDLGKSLWLRTPVTEEIAHRIHYTLEIAVIATVLTALIALPAGIISAVRQDTWVDYSLRVFSIAGLAIPSFWLGILIILGLVIFFAWLPPVTWAGLFENPSVNLQQLLWPAIATGYRQAAVVTRMTRATMLEVLREDYIRTAWSKGLKERSVLWAHALKNAMLPVVTMLGIELSLLMGGLAVTETVFNVPGIGKALVDSVMRRDYPMVQAIVVMMAFFVMAMNLVVDLLYSWLDPRVRYR